GIRVLIVTGVQTCALPIFTPGFGEPVVAQQDGRTVLTLDQSDILAPKPPVGAPLRYRRVGGFQASSFKSWSEVSKLMAPLFASRSEERRVGKEWRTSGAAV